MTEFTVRGLLKRTLWVCFLPCLVPCYLLGFIPSTVCFEINCLGCCQNSSIGLRRTLASSVWPVWFALAPLSWWLTGNWRRLPNLVCCAPALREWVEAGD